MAPRRWTFRREHNLAIWSRFEKRECRDCAEAVEEIHRRILEPLDLADIHLEGFEPVPADQLPRRYHWATPTFREEAGVNVVYHIGSTSVGGAAVASLVTTWKLLSSRLVKSGPSLPSRSPLRMIVFPAGSR